MISAFYIDEAEANEDRFWRPQRFERRTEDVNLEAARQLLRSSWPKPTPKSTLETSPEKPAFHGSGKTDDGCHCYICSHPWKKNPDVKRDPKTGELVHVAFKDRLHAYGRIDEIGKPTIFGYGYQYPVNEPVPLPYTLRNPHSSCSLKDPDNCYSSDIVIPIEIIYHWDRCEYCQLRWPVDPRRKVIAWLNSW